MSQTPRIAIVGGGFTGAAAAIELLRKFNQSFDLVIIEPDELGRGIAYGKAESFHLLNVRAGKLGVLSDSAGDFSTWTAARSSRTPPAFDSSGIERAFLPRRAFGNYVEERLVEAIAQRPDVGFTHIRSVSKSIRRNSSGYEVALKRHPALVADFVVLATGYGRQPERTSIGRSAFAALDPEEVRSARSALFIGTGLTFVDEFLRLKNRGFRGQALAISRHGFLPQLHRANEAPKRTASSANPRLSDLVRRFRKAMAESDLPASAAVDLILGMRSGLQGLWQSLPVREQHQFLRHLRSYWNIARHRLPPETNAQLRQSMELGILRISAGSATSIAANRVEIAVGTGNRERRDFDLVFDCTGHVPEVRSPLILSLIRQGLARHDAHRLGVSVRPNGAVIGRLGSNTPGLFALGPLGHGSLYEITAVPEIVAQCAAMATSLAADARRLRTRALPAAESRRWQARPD